VVSSKPVGTPDYIAPELLQVLTNDKHPKTVHNETCDFWSMGIIGYELVTETTPFHDTNINIIYTKILQHCENRENQLLFSHLNVSDEFEDLLNNLVTGLDRRLNFYKIRHHAYFKSVDWDKLQDQVPPIIPNISGAYDISNFDDVDRSNKQINKVTFTTNKLKNSSSHDLGFLGFSFVKQSNSTMDRAKHEFENHIDVINVLKIKINAKNNEIKQLKNNLLVAENNYEQISSIDIIHDDTIKELEMMKDKLKDKCVELATSKMEIKNLKNALQIEEDMKKTVQTTLLSTYQKWEKAKKISDQNYEKLIAEKRKELSGFVQKLTERENEMMNKVEACAHLQKTISNYKELLQITKQQNMVDKNEYEKMTKELGEIHETKVCYSLLFKIKVLQIRDCRIVG
jgi:citron Rho-interacting kinase